MSNLGIVAVSECSLALLLLLLSVSGVVEGREIRR